MPRLILPNGDVFAWPASHAIVAATDESITFRKLPGSMRGVGVWVNGAHDESLPDVRLPEGVIEGATIGMYYSGLHLQSIGRTPTMIQDRDLGDETTHYTDGKPIEALDTPDNASVLRVWDGESWHICVNGVPDGTIEPDEPALSQAEAVKRCLSRLVEAMLDTGDAFDVIIYSNVIGIVSHHLGHHAFNRTDPTTPARLMDLANRTKNTSR